MYVSHKCICGSYSGWKVLTRDHFTSTKSYIKQRKLTCAPCWNRMLVCSIPLICRLLQNKHWNSEKLFFHKTYSLRFKIKVTFGHKLRYEIKVTFGEISLKLRQTNWNVARNNVNVVADELPSQIIVYTYSIIDIWTRRRRCTSTWFYVWDQLVSIVNGDEQVLLWTPLARRKELSESYAMHTVSC